MFTDVTSLKQVPLHALETHYTHYYPLIAEGVKNLDQLCWMRERDLLRIEGMGPVRVAHIQEALAKLGLALRR